MVRSYYWYKYIFCTSYFLNGNLWSCPGFAASPFDKLLGHCAYNWSQLMLLCVPACVLSLPPPHSRGWSCLIMVNFRLFGPTSGICVCVFFPFFFFFTRLLLQIVGVLLQENTSETCLAKMHFNVRFVTKQINNKYLFIWPIYNQNKFVEKDLDACAAVWK